MLSLKIDDFYNQEAMYISLITHAEGKIHSLFKLVLNP